MTQEHQVVMTLEEKAALLDRLIAPKGIVARLVQGVEGIVSSADGTGCSDNLTVVDAQAVDLLAELIGPLQARFGDAGGQVTDRLYRGELELDGELLFSGEFRAPVAALTPELDQAFMALIAQRATIRYTRG